MMTTGNLLYVVWFLIFPTAMSSFALKGKRALVTGSSGGIGAAIAKRLAQEGCEVLVHYHTRYNGAGQTQKSIVSSGGNCAGIIQCDFRSPTAIKRLFQTIDEQIWPGGFDILVNNAGLITKLALDDDDDDLSRWHETMQVNLNAPLQLSRLARSCMLKRNNTEGGVIVMVSSIHGARSVEYMSAYAVSKAALDSLTRGLALEYAPDRIRVNGIAPGVVPVERTAAAFANSEVVDMWRKHLPVDRVGSVEEVAEATLPLLTNAWITGAIHTIDGGMSARINMPNRPRPDPSSSEKSPVVSDQVQFESSKDSASSNV